MATQEKLLKSLETLKGLSAPNQTSDASKKKDKIQHCHVVTEAISNATIKIAPNFHTYLSITIEVLLQLCDDREADVRMTAGDCLNRIIRAMNDENMRKVQIELHKGINRNGPARSLRAALKRFAQLAHLIRPHKGKPYVVNLFPTLIKVAERSEEQIHETLAHSTMPIIKALGSFASDAEIKALLKGFMKNIPHESATIRRSATTSILQICLNCRKPHVFFVFVVSHLLELLIPVNDSQNIYLILGVLMCLRNLLPHLNDSQEQYSNTLDKSRMGDGASALDKSLQIYELCVYYLSHKDHNVVNASLETLNILFQSCTTEFRQVAVCESGIDKSRITAPAFRSPSQLSVATSAAAAEDLFVESELTDTLRSDIEKWIDESKLTVMNMTCAKTGELEKTLSIESKSSSVDTGLNQFDSIEYDSIVPGSKPHSIGDHLDTLTLSDDSSDKSFSYIEEQQYNQPHFQDIAVGYFLENDTSIVYCARLISKLFLLSGHVGSVVSDRSVRVSTKSLALSCLASIINIHPKVLTLYLDKNCDGNLPKNVCRQAMADVLLYESHSDPHLRGIVRTLTCNFILAVLNDNDRNDYDEWIEKHCRDRFERFQLESLVEIIIKGLEDESSSCVKQTVISLGTCLEKISESSNGCLVLPILDILPRLATNPYWLVKSALCDLVSTIPYVTIYDITDSTEFQNSVVSDILFKLLEDEDVKVRSGAANAVVTIIPYLYFDQFRLKETIVTTKAIQYRNLYLSNLYDGADSDHHKKHLVDDMPFPFSEFSRTSCDKIEFALSKMVSKLYNCLLTATSNYFIYGCIETLSLLSNKYPTTVYTRAWNCHKARGEIGDERKENSGVTLDLFHMCVYLLSHSILCYDLTCHLNLLNLSSNLFSGYSLCLLKTISDTELPTKPWEIFSHAAFSTLAEQYTSHMIKLLNILRYVLDEVLPSQHQSKPVLSNLTTSSPIKRRKSDLDKKVLSPSKTPEREDRDKKEGHKSSSAGSFAHLPHYTKMYDILRQAYSNYKTTLEYEACEKFLSLLRQTLHSFSVLMEVGTLAEFQGVAEEVLSYFRFTFALEASATVSCVQQLLKCLFGNNLTAKIGEVRLQLEEKQGPTEEPSGFYYNVYQKSYGDVSKCFSSLKSIRKVGCDGDNTVMGYLHRKDVKPLPPRSSDKILASYIRIFEPMVIKSLKHYTITSDVQLQCKVLQLLNQLIQLRVNYCLLDSEQIFIGFVLKQFDYIEKGQIPYADDLIKKIFQFLAQLSHSKQHSKSIITIPKIINACDDLMASEQSPVTHCIPALQPIVENIFLIRNKSNTTDAKELETTRDVVLSMLLRLYEYHEVIDLITLILDDSKYCDNSSEKWLRWSTQVIDVILPMLKQNKIRLDTSAALVSLRRLVFALEPSVFEPIDNIILMVFQEPLIYDNWKTSFTRYLAKILISILILSPLKEDTLLAKINELKINFAPGSVFENCVPTTDPLNVLNSTDVFHGVPPEMIFIRFVFKVIAFASRHCAETSKSDEREFLVEEISILLMYCAYIFQSGSHCKIAVYAMNNHNSVRLEEIGENFFRVAHEYPNLMFLWCYVLSLFNYSGKQFWIKTMDLNLSRSVNYKIISTGCVISVCDYMNQDVFKSDQLSWFLNYVLQIVDLCDEEPVAEFISSIHRNSSTSRTFIESLTKRSLKSVDTVFVFKILKSVENTHPSHTGSLLRLLLPDFLLSPELAVSRSVANLASRKIELLLTMSTREVNDQLLKEDLLNIIQKMVVSNLVRRHEALASLLNKLCTQCYEISPLEFDQRRSINSDYIKTLQIDKNWFLTQIKEKCNSRETVQLLTRLDFEELIGFFKSVDSNKILFKECVRLGLSYKTRSENAEPALIKATVECLLDEVTKICNLVPQPHQVYNVQKRGASNAEDEFSSRMTELFESTQFFHLLYEIIPSVSFFVNSSKTSLADDQSEVLVKFGVICLESIVFLICSNKEFNMNYIDLAIRCSEAVLKDNKLLSVLHLNTNISWVCSIINSLYKFVEYLLTRREPLPTIPKSVLKTSLGYIETASVGEACYQLYTLLTWLYKCQRRRNASIPKFIFAAVKSIIVSLSRLPVFNSFMLIPVQVWKGGWSPELVGPFHIQVPPLPTEYLQEIEILEEFIYRITLLGWTSRQQFEETWMCLLSVLCNNFEDKEAIVAQDVVHASSLAVKAITALLVQTLYSPVPGNTNVSRLTHASRYPVTQHTSSISVEKLKKIQNKIEEKHSESAYLSDARDVFKLPNFEKRFQHYSYGQMSVKYLLVATKIVENCQTSEFWVHEENLLKSSALDVNSCLQFLLDYYTQSFENRPTTPLRFLHEIVRSTVIISDLFTDKSQFNWMLETFLELSKVHTVDDELLHQYLIVGIAKAAAVLTPDLETYENVKKLLMQYLKSSFLPSRMACLHGLLYILEGCKLSNISIGGISEEMQIILPCAVEYVQCNLSSNNKILKQSQEHTVLMWTLAFFLIENVDETHLESTFVSNTLQTAFTLLLQETPTNTLNVILMKAFERLVIFNKNIVRTVGKQIMNLALEKTKNDNPCVSILGMQLLLTYMYTDCSEQLKEAASRTNPDHLVQTIEKIYAIFEHIKRGYVFEIEVLCYVLPDILSDFFSPSDVLTKVIGEFLSPQQPHPKLLSRVVFQVFERAIEEKQLPLLQDWVVFSLSNFTQSLSVGMATWCLTCFFISASSNRWLRLFFPYVQTRVGRYEYEDRKMLCIAGADFYNNLTSKKQKDSFVENFNKIKDQPDTLFNDLLSSL